MTDGQLLLLVFSIIYTSDAIAWFGERGYLLRSFYGKKLLIRRHRFFFPGFNIGAGFLNPLPNLGKAYVAELLPFSITAKGLSPISIENPNPGQDVVENQHAKAYRWDEIKKIKRDQKTLYINGIKFRKFSDVHSAAFWRDTLNEIRETPKEDDRGVLIRKVLNHYFCEKRARQRMRIFEKRTFSLRLLGSLLFVVVFLLLPTTYIIFREAIQLLYISLIMWVLMLQLSIETFCLHRRLFPNGKGDRLQHLFLSLFLPNIAIRSADFLSKPFFHDTHPLPLAKAGSAENSLLRFKQALARDIQFPIPIKDTGLESEIAEEFRSDYYLPIIQVKLPDLDKLTDPPEPIEDPAYCPRCLTPYNSLEFKCQDCGGIQVVKNDIISEPD